MLVPLATKLNVDLQNQHTFPPGVTPLLCGMTNKLYPELPLHTELLPNNGNTEVILENNNEQTSIELRDGSEMAHLLFLRSLTPHMKQVPRHLVVVVPSTHVIEIASEDKLKPIQYHG